RPRRRSRNPRVAGAGLRVYSTANPSLAAAGRDSRNPRVAGDHFVSLRLTNRPRAPGSRALAIAQPAGCPSRVSVVSPRWRAIRATPSVAGDHFVSLRLTNRPRAAGSGALAIAQPVGCRSARAARNGSGSGALALSAPLVPSTGTNRAPRRES